MENNVVKIIPVLVPRYNVVAVQPSLPRELVDSIPKSPVLEITGTYGDIHKMPSEQELRDFARKAGPLVGGAKLREGAIDAMPEDFFTQLYQNLVFGITPTKDLSAVRCGNFYDTSPQNITSLALASAMLSGLVDFIRVTTDPSLMYTAEQFYRLLLHVNYTWIRALDNINDLRLVYAACIVQVDGITVSRYVWIDGELAAPYIEKGWSLEAIAKTYTSPHKKLRPRL